MPVRMMIRFWNTNDERENNINIVSKVANSHNLDCNEYCLVINHNRYRMYLINKPYVPMKSYIICMYNEAARYS